MLRRALDRFPAGTGKRWEVVQAYVRTRTVDEILDMVKHGLKAGGGSAPGAWAAAAAARRVCTRLVAGGWAASAEVCGVSGRLAGCLAAAQGLCGCYEQPRPRSGLSSVCTGWFVPFPISTSPSSLSSS